MYNPAVISNDQEQMNDMVGQLVAGLADGQEIDEDNAPNQPVPATKAAFARSSGRF